MFSRSFFRQEDAQGLTEYSFILMLIVIACVIVLEQLGLEINGIFEYVALKI